MRIVDGRNHRFGGLASDARDRHQPNDVGMLGSKLIELGFEGFKLAG